MDTPAAMTPVAVVLAVDQGPAVMVVEPAQRRARPVQCLELAEVQHLIVTVHAHSIVALASATFMVVSTRFVYFQHYLEGDHIEIDPSRIAASVVSGP